MAFDPNRWTIKTQEAFNAALESARSANHAEVLPEHLLAALLRQPEGVVVPLLQKVGVDPKAVLAKVEEQLSRQVRAVGGEASMSRRLRDVIERADTIRSDLRDEFVSTEHV